MVKIFINYKIYIYIYKYYINMINILYNIYVNLIYIFFFNISVK